MKHSELREVLRAVYGSYGTSVMSDLVLAPLQGRTGAQALADGEDPDRIWAAICEVNNLGEGERWWHRRQEHPITSK